MVTKQTGLLNSIMEWSNTRKIVFNHNKEAAVGFMDSMNYYNNSCSQKIILLLLI